MSQSSDNLITVSLNEFLLIFVFCLLVVVLHFWRLNTESQLLLEQYKENMSVLLGASDVDFSDKEKINEMSKSVSELLKSQWPKDENLSEVLSHYNVIFNRDSNETLYEMKKTLTTIKQELAEIELYISEIYRVALSSNDLGKVPSSIKKLRSIALIVEGSEDLSAKLKSCEVDYKGLFKSCSGKGVSMPSCLTSPVSGRTEYAALIEMYDDGYKVLEEHAGALMVTGERQPGDLSKINFTKYGLELYNSGRFRERECRYIVKVRDFTSDKASYRSALKEVERFFYKREVK